MPGLGPVRVWVRVQSVSGLYSVVFGSCFFVILGSYVGSWLFYICYPRIRVSAREYSILVQIRFTICFYFTYFTFAIDR